jgi:hypothetical protein
MCEGVWRVRVCRVSRWVVCEGVWCVRVCGV